MSEADGRRIKRNLLLDTSSVRFLNEDDLQGLCKAKLLSPYLEEKIQEISRHNHASIVYLSAPVNRRRLTILGTLRAYLTAYLKAHHRIYQPLTLMVRPLEPDANGLPLQINSCTNTTNWIAYECIQADIFDQNFAVIPEFDLRAHQAPAGHDLRSLRHSLSNM